MQAEDSTTRLPLRDVLHHPAARALLLSRVVSDIGDFLGLAAILLYAFEESGSLVGPGAAFAAQALPAVLIGLFAGRRLNRTHPRRGLVITHLAAAGIVAVIATTPPLPVVLLAIVGLGAARTTSSSLRMAAIASSVPVELRQRMLGLSSTSYQSGQVIGFVGGAALTTALSPAVALWADAATFLVAAAMLANPAIVRAPVTAEQSCEPRIGSCVARAVDSLRYVFSDRALAVLIPLAWLTMLTSALPETAAPALAEPAHVGLLMAAAPAASAVAAARYAARPRTSLGVLTAQAARYGVALMLLALAIAWKAPMPVLLLAILLVGAGNVWIVGVQTRLANLEDPSRVAEVYAALTASMIALEGIGAGMLGLLDAIAGPALTVGVLAGVLTLLAVIGGRRRAERPRVGGTLREAAVAAQEAKAARAAA